MKVLLLNPPAPKGMLVNRDVMGGFGTLQGRKTLPSPMPPLKLAYVAAMLERGGFSVQLQDSVLTADTQSEAIGKVVAAGPDTVGLETSFETVDLDLDTASKIKNMLNVPIFMLGAFVSTRPEYIFKRSNLSFLVREEPEASALELVRAFRDQKTDYSFIKGISYRVQDNIFHNPDRPFLEALSSLPYPARHLLTNERYICNKGKPGVTILASRGCPIACPYCAYGSVQGPRWRHREPWDVTQEIKEVYFKYGIKYLQFRDAIFTFNRSWAMDICDLIIKEGLGGKISWICETAVKYLDKELLRQMKKAGCRHIGIGVETADQELQKKYARNKIISNKHAKEVFAACRQLGISTCAFFMLGFPEDTYESIKRSIDLAKELDPDEIQFAVVTPYPGTKIAEILDKGGRRLTMEEVSDLRKKAYVEFYSRPTKLLREAANPLVLGRKIIRGMLLLRGR